MPLEQRHVESLLKIALNIKPKPSGKKAKAKGSREQLNLQSGANQVRIIKDGLRSNVAILNL